MHDPIAAGRRTALHAVAAQVAATALVALGFALQGPAHVLAAGWGGGVMAIGNLLAARVALGGIAPAGAAFASLMLGTLLKWAVVLAGCAVGFGLWRLPPLPMLAGLALGLVVYLLALNLGGFKQAISKTGDRVEK